MTSHSRWSVFHKKGSSGHFDSQLQTSMSARQAEYEIEQWGSSEQLTKGTLTFLKQQGFTSLEMLYLLTPQKVKDCIEKQGLLPLAQCCALEKAVQNLHFYKDLPVKVDEEMRTWGKSMGLSSATLNFLSDQGFKSLRAMHLLTPDEWNDSLHTFDTLPLAQRIQLRQAVSSLHSKSRSNDVNLRCPESAISRTEIDRLHRNGNMKAGTTSFNTNGKGSNNLIETPFKVSAVRLILVGKSGSGISATGNTILGKTLFKTALSSRATTEKCETTTVTKNGITLEITDTPGLGHPKRSNEEIAKEILSHVTGLPEAPRVVIYVIRYKEYTQEDITVYTTLKNTLQPFISKNMLLAFTWGDMLTSKRDTINDYVHREGGNLLAVFRENGKQFVVVNNLEEPSKDNSDLLLNEIIRYVYRDSVSD